jgi:hypothetical protein
MAERLRELNPFSKSQKADRWSRARADALTPEEYQRLAMQPTFPRAYRVRTDLDEFKRKRDEAAAQWKAA